jgi:hypothetical protein
MKPYLHDSWDQTDVRCDFIEDESGEWYKREDVHILLARKDAEILALKEENARLTELLRLEFRPE